MSDFQLGLLAAGILVVLGVYGFGFWQQRQFRRKLNSTFDVNRTDVLTKEPTPKVVEPVVDDAEHTLDFTHLDETIPDTPADTQLSELTVPSTADSSCDLIETARDYIAIFNLDLPQNCDFLATVWDRRFVFGKSIVVCGLNVSNLSWERVVQESRATYTTFRVAMQLVDRNGPASEAKLTSFYELIQQIAQQLAIDVDISDVADASKRAIKLDEFCAKSDQIIGINIRIKDSRSLFASEVAQVVQMLDFSLQADGKFHLLDSEGQTLFTLGDRGELPFQHHTLNQTRVQALTLLLDVPHVASPVVRFGQMAELAQQLASELKGVVVDDNERELTQLSITQIQSQVGAVEAEMLAGGIVAGSAQARRIFS
jgi:FtsZ-interacting cell division protein ZipA